MTDALPDPRDASVSAPTHLVTLYGRPGCHLCDDARAELEPLASELGFSLQEVDITGDDRLHRALLERIPVVAVDGCEICDFYLDEDGLRAALARPIAAR